MGSDTAEEPAKKTYSFIEHIGDVELVTGYFVAQEDLKSYMRLSSRANMLIRGLAYSMVNGSDLEKLKEHYNEAPQYLFLDHYSRHDFLVTPVIAFQEQEVIMRIIAGADVMRGRFRDFMINGLAVPVPRIRKDLTRENIADLRTNLMLMAHFNKTVLAFRWKGRDYGQAKAMEEETGLIEGILGSFNTLSSQFGLPVDEAYFFSGSLAYSRVPEDERFLDARLNKTKGNVERTESSDEVLLIKDLLLPKKMMYIHVADRLEVMAFLRKAGLIDSKGQIRTNSVKEEPNAKIALSHIIYEEAQKLKHPMPIQIVSEAVKRVLAEKGIVLNDEYLASHKESHKEQLSIGRDDLYSKILDVRDELIGHKEIIFRDSFECVGNPLSPQYIFHEAMPHLFQDRPTPAGSLIIGAAKLYRSTAELYRSIARPKIATPKQESSKQSALDTLIGFGNQTEPLRDVLYETRKGNGPVVEVHNLGVIAYYSSMLRRMF